ADCYPFPGAVFFRRPGRPSPGDQSAETSKSLEDCQPLDTRLYLANEEDSEYQNNTERRPGAAPTRRLCHHQQSFRLPRRDCSRQPFPGNFCIKKRGEELAHHWLVDNALRDSFYQSPKKGAHPVGG